MRVTRVCKVLWAVTVIMWAAGLVAAVAVAYPGFDHPWWLVLMRGPLYSAGAAGLTIALTMWHVVAALPRMFDAGVKHGRDMCERTHQDAQVLPMQGRRSRAELS